VIELSPWRLRHGVRALCLSVGLVGIQVMAAEPAPVPESQQLEDVQLLLRTGQLQQWLNQPITLNQGLCIQQRYSMRWPAAPTGPSTDREEDVLRLAREFCTAASGDGKDDSLRLVTDAKANFQDRLKRLYGLRLTIQACVKQSAAGQALEACVIQAAGRPLSEQEQTWLMAAVRP